ncbi:ABC transporter ATP-binding protein [Thiocapsa bogorovii]|uniref:ABC transporter ATP-binding protein n=1 Tax=Thiocapsa bogorovii TaxID=521689 RepID=UPI001E449029|nr:ATP-binding cassette domain-containing protein [Thiocapsa bogorovii]UHD18787.1 ATP-binding cassette domain-containing protein [Thiocapsa bogorovii]
MSELRLDGIRSRTLGPLDLTIVAAELVFVSGPSGSGKSLLLRAVADLDPHDGEVWLGGEPRSRIAPSTWRRRVGLLPAEAFWWAETVGEHLPGIRSTHADVATPEPSPPPRLPSPLRPAILRLPKPFRRPPGRVANHPALPDPSTVTDWLSQLGFSPDVLGWSVTRLSTGERQRLALVRLLAQTPEALLLDEATANLDPSNGARVEAVVETYRKAQGAAVLWVSHDPEQRRRIGGRSLIIRNERLEPEA